ncbi:MAG: efflux RND transporter periplasmic adaptor subunit [Alphaproteobacteria bacterium]|jgi:membrane fusion protein (multidrug efflux system)|nr:efflux RND transporter periplasmic adaptor subunit [Alphaproteobacteria bacterium]MDP7223491.1 efflux RND transporter periplasmic adaptor subunit [Alphaproteobacteria bacterium]
MKKHYILIALLFVLTGVVSFSVWKYTGAEDGTASAASSAAAPAQPVSVLEVKQEQIMLSRTLPGRVSAFRQSQVRPQVNGLIMERLFEEGSYVEEGQQLYQIDDARYKAALASAQADLRSARSTIASIKARTDRYKKLVKIDAVSQQEYDDVKAQLDQANAAVAVAKAAVDVAQVNLDYTKVYAPISGRIGRTLVTEGALVTANQAQALAVITQLDPVYVDMQQASIEAMTLQQARLEGQESLPVTLMLGENNEIAYPHEGRLKFSEVTIDETTGSITLRAVVPNPDDVLLPGLFVRAALGVGEKDVVLVPQRAAIRKPDGSLSVWVVDQNNTAQPRPIDVSNAHEDSWIVTGGLQPGETVIVAGYQKVGPGAPVSPSPWQGSQAGSQTGSQTGPQHDEQAGGMQADAGENTVTHSSPEQAVALSETTENEEQE